MPQVFNFIYLSIAVIMSLFYGFFAGRIFIINWNEFKFLQRVYQFIFNLFGGVFGFMALYYEINKMYIELNKSDFTKMNIGDPFILVIAMLGTMGLLPRAMAGLAEKLNIKLP